MNNLSKVIESKVKVRFPDCDPFNHLNNSKYLDYFLNAREDQLIENYDFDLHKLAKEKGISWVVGQSQITYMSPAVLMETVVIESKLIAFDAKSLTMEAIMWNEDKTIVKALLWSKFVHFDLRTLRTQVHSEELTSFFEKIVAPFDSPVTFEERGKSFRFEKLLI